MAMAKRTKDTGTSSWVLDQRRRQTKPSTAPRKVDKPAPARGPSASKRTAEASEWLVTPNRRTNGATAARRSPKKPARRRGRADRKLRNRLLEGLQRRLTSRESGRKGLSDLDSITFEELRGAGLSITQAAKFIAYREQNGGVDSPARLDAVPGLSQRSRKRLEEIAG